MQDTDLAAPGGRSPRSGPPLRQTPEDRAVADAVYASTGAELRQFIERAEQLEAEKRETAELIRSVFAEARGRGFDTKALRRIIALRRRRPDEIAEEEAVLEAYRAALGMV